MLPYRDTYLHADEVAEPGYYSVFLSSGIRVRLAASVRSGIAEVSFLAGQDAHTLLLQLSRNLTRVSDAAISISGRRATGLSSSEAFCGLGNRYRIYFVLESEETPQTIGTYDELRVTPSSDSASGLRVGGYLAFAPSVKTVHFKVGLSYVSVANAVENMNREITGWDLATVRSEARSAWNDVLSLLLVRGGTPDQRKVFYTTLISAG